MENNTKKGVIKVGEFKGRPVMALHFKEEEKHALKFGQAKAGLIIANFAEIKAFHDKVQSQVAGKTA